MYTNAVSIDNTSYSLMNPAIETYILTREDIFQSGNYEINFKT